MHLRTLGVLFTAVAAAAAGGCKDKKQPGASTGSGSASAASPREAGGSAADETASAASGDLSGLEPTSDCPKTLEGKDDGLARTIKKACGPIQVKGNYVVEGQLTIEAGAQLVFQTGASLSVGRDKPSKLEIDGTAADPVRFTAAGDQAAGSWAGVRVFPKAPRSTITGLVIESAGDKQGALHIDAVGVVLADVTIKNAAEIGLWITNLGSIEGGTGLRFDRAGKIAVSLPPAAVGGLGAANTFSDGAYVQIRGGEVQQETTWHDPGTYYVVEQDIRIRGLDAHAKITIDPGVELRFRPGTFLLCGELGPGSIDARGTKDQPIVFRSSEGDEPGSWRGLGVFGKGELTLVHATVQNGGESDWGAVHLSDGGALTIKDSIIKNSTVGIAIKKGATVKAIDTTHFEGNGTAIKLTPNHVGLLGAGNTYAAGQPILIEGGAVTTDQTWLLQPGAEVRVKGTFDVVAAKLDLAAGIELRFDGTGTFLHVSRNHSGGSLRVNGTAGKPVVLRGVRDGAGAWGGVELDHKSSDNHFEHVVIQDTAAEAAITVASTTGANLASVTFSRVKAGVKAECKATVTAADVKIDGGAPAETRPSGC